MLISLYFLLTGFTKIGGSEGNGFGYLKNNAGTEALDFSTESKNFPPDSVQASDTTQIDSMALDSTARIKYFKFQRKDNLVVPLSVKKKSPFFVYPSSINFKRKIELDSTGNFVIISEYIAGQKTKIPLVLPLKEYIKLRMKSVLRKGWEKIGYKYNLKKNKNDLANLLSGITKIEIPLPSTSFLSIFGPPKISLNINGSVTIHGAWRNETTHGLTASRLGNTRNEPDFKQQVQLNLSGMIGDKLKISADWNTERTFDYQNQLKIKYTGYDDDIVKSIEAGNVSLSTSPLVGGSEALFGIKAKFQLGPFSLTALASQKKSQVKEISVKGGSEKHQFEIHAYDYAENHYFLDTIYASKTYNIFNNIFGHANPVIGAVENFYRIKDIEVWKTTTGIVNTQKERKGNAFLNLPGRLLSPGEIQPYPDSLRSNLLTEVNGQNVIGGRFVKLTPGTDYDYNPYAGFITFKTNIQPTDAIGIAYRIEGPEGDKDIYYGEFLKEIQTDTAKTIVLKLIKPPNLQPSYKQAWKLMLKNIYAVGGRDVKKEGFKFDIDFVVEGQDPVDNINGNKLITLFGLDKTDESGTSTQPDGAFDYLPGQTILPQTGEIVFPVLEPFGKDLPKQLDPNLAYQAVYDTTKTFAKQDRAKDKFLLKGEYSASSSSVYNIGFNVVENSVKVYLNGQELKLGRDYTVDYNIGQIVIRNSSALVPGANLRITYEQNDLFQLASKTLLGLRGLLEIDRNSSLGFSILNLNQQTLSDKVRIGEEPLNNTIMGVDFKTLIKLPFLTKGLDYLFSTKEMSKISFNGEVAYMNPEPNTKKSTISSDKGKSIAYIDDFEGAKRIIPIGISYSAWSDLSPPDDLPYLPNLDYQQKMSYKAKSYWYNVLPSDVFVQDIWGNRKQVARQDRQVTALDYVFQPTKRGSYNMNPKLSEPKKNWGGMMKLLSSTANNLVEENIQFIEFWMDIEEAPPNAKLYIDLGEISEDVIPNGLLDTEDKNQNDIVDPGEDTGLDGLTDEQERARDTIGLGPDPAGDDFSFELTSNPDYSRINGTEGNASLTDVGRLPNTEDLNRNFTLDRLNSYFRYEVPLDTTNKFIAGGGEGNRRWYLFRIPLKDFIKKIGDPSFTLVEYIRLWIEGVDSPVHIRLAELNLVGNQWRKALRPPKVTENDTVLTVSTINIEDNPNYTSPPGVFRERDRTRPDEVVYKNEQSLQLIFNGLEEGDYRDVVKYLYKPVNLFNYNQMKLFVHGDENDADPNSISYKDAEGNYNAEVYFRFGSDSLNYYEYRQPVEAGWNEISVDFKEITAIKAVRDSINKLYKVPVNGKPGHFYGIMGNPSLTKVSFFTIGVINPRKNTSQPDNGRLYGEVWVNELRLVGADNTPGWAYTASASLKLADLMTINANVGRTDPYFHKLAQRFGSKVGRQAWGVNVNLDVSKLIPFNIKGSNLRISYSHNESVANPLYKPGTDIKMEEAISRQEKELIDSGLSPSDAKKIVNQFKSDVQTLNISDTWNLNNLRIKIPSNKWYIKDIINNLSFGFTFNKRISRSPTVQINKKWTWRANARYSLNFSRENYFYPANIPILGEALKIFKDYRNVKVYFTPQSFNLNFTANRKYNYLQSRPIHENEAYPKPNIQRDFTATRSGSINWKITEGGFINLSLAYKLNIASSLAYLLTDETGRERSEKQIWKEILTSAFFGKDYNYNQTFSLRTNPRLPTIWNLDRFFRISAGYNVNYRWQNNFQQEELGRSAGFANTINASLSIRLKSLFAPLFKTRKKFTSGSVSTRSRFNRRRTRRGKVSLEAPISNKAKKDSTKKKKKVKEQTTPFYVKTLEYIKDFIHWTMFDYDNINIRFNQSNSMGGSGLLGKQTGFSNFWGFRQQQREGPSRLFMLGLSYDLGPRAPNGNLSDKFSQKNSISISTQRPLWEGANITFNWNVNWGMNKSTSISTDEMGNITINNLTSNGTLTKTFLSFPSFLIIKNGLTQVEEFYLESGGPASDNPNAALSSAFLKGFETFPWLSRLPFLKSITKYIPRPNWRLTWNGIEKYWIFKKWAKSITLSHAYTSNYSEGWRINPDGLQETQTQKISYGFTPLIGLNVIFNSLWHGNFSASFKFDSKKTYTLGISTRNITEATTQNISLTATYSKKGFSIPLFGLSLKNDIEISLSYTKGKNAIVIFDMDNYSENGKPQDGTTRTELVPRIKYVLSSRVTLSFYYKRSSVEPEGASRIPPTTTNEGGLDVSIRIQ